jgi:glycosyltransferase involved in cell wall biosynthesis
MPTFYKKVTTIHDCAVFYEFEGRHKVAKAYCRMMQNFSARLSDKIIAITNFGKNEIVKYHKVDRDKIVVVLNGINEDFYEPINREVESRVNIRIQEFSRYILYYGGYRKHKNVKALLKAFSQSERKDMKLVLVGSHSAVESFLVDYDNDLKNIIVWGFATNEELKCLLDNCEAFIFPSIYEGFGLPIAEAMARKAKTICKNIEVAREVGHDCVYYFDDQADLVNIIKNIESIPKKSNSITYHWEDSISEYINLYNSI